MEQKNVLLSVENGIAHILLNRPEMGNAMTTAMFQELQETIEACAKESSVRVLVLSGAGKHFSAGGCIPEFCEMLKNGGELADEVLLGAEALVMSVRRCPKPVIAQINGAAAGAGCGLALAADFRIMGAKGALITAFTNLAVPGDSFTMYSLAHMVGISRAAQYMMAGNPITAYEAFEMGIAYAVADEDVLPTAVQQLAEKLAAGPSEAFARQKMYLTEVFFKDMEALSKREFSDMKGCSRLPDFSEALAAFREKRPPDFKK